jgi:hypothetical protein
VTTQTAYKFKQNHKSFRKQSFQILVCTSIYFLALSHAPPLLEAEMAIYAKGMLADQMNDTARPQKAALRQKREAYLDARDQRAGKQPGERADAEEGAGEQRREQHERAGRHHLPERRVRGDPDAAGVVRRGAALHEARDGGELAAHLLHHLERRAAHAPHRHRREPVREHGANEQPHEHLGVQHVHVRDARAAHERAEQRQRHQRGGPDGEALADGRGGVAGGVKRVGHLPDAAAHAGHLGDPAGVVADGAIGVDGQPGGDRAQHPERRHRDAVDGGQREADVDGHGDGEDGHDDGLVPEGEAEDDVGRRAGLARVGHIPDRAASFIRTPSTRHFKSGTIVADEINYL